MASLETTTIQTFAEQSDHDALVELKVMLRSVLQEMQSLREQMREMVGQQAAALTSWEVKSNAVHDAHDGRLRKLEELAIRYVPYADETQKRLQTIDTDIEMLKTGKTALLGGWKTVIFIITTLFSFTGFIYAIVNIVNLFALHLH